MPAKVHTSIQGTDAMASAIVELQTYAGRPVSKTIDHQARAAEIIKLQKYYSTISASTPSGFKFDPAKINKSIDDQLLGAKMIELQNAANNT